MARELPGRSRFFYERFVQEANTDNPFDSNDLERFYHFIWVAHLGRTKFGDADVMRQLIRDGFDTKDAEELSLIYYRCRMFMSSRATMPYVPSGVWTSRPRE